MGRGRGRGGRGRGRGRGRSDDDKEWVPITKLGRLVKEQKIKSLEEIFLFSMPIKEYQIVDLFLGTKLKDEVMGIMPVQKQTTAGQRTRFKAFVAVGDFSGHVGLGVKCAKGCYRHPRCHHHGEDEHHSNSPWLLGKTGWTAAHRFAETYR